MSTSQADIQVEIGSKINVIFKDGGSKKVVDTGTVFYIGPGYCSIRTNHCHTFDRVKLKRDGTIHRSCSYRNDYYFEEA